MRLSLVTDTYLPEINGVTTVLAVMRAGLVERGHTVQVVAPGYPGARGDDAGVVRRPSVALPGYAQSRLGIPVPGVGRALAEFAPDVVHVITEGIIGSAGRRFALRRQIPLVTSFHTDFPRYAARYLGDWAVEPVRRYLRWFHGPAALTQTPSEATRDELQALGLGRAMVWGRGVDTRLFTPVRRSDERRRELGADGRVLVLHVSRLAAEKDIETLLESFRLAHDVLGDAARFVVAGDGPRAVDVRAALPFARHLGFLDRTTLANLYADADLFVFPSPTETCGLVLLEAMASGIPVVASDRGGVRENLRPGLNGLQARAGNAAGFAGAVVELSRNGAQRNAMGQAARAFAVARDWQCELDTLGPLYHGLVQAPQGARARVHGRDVAEPVGAR
jgi:glycosyltransferase involved in cell wall biosynthesis